MAIALLVVVGLTPGRAAAAAAGPSASLSSTTAAPGERVDVTGLGWRKGALVTVQTCGNAALDDSVDCDVANSRDVGVRDDGTLAGALIVTLPPKPCPCLVRAVSGDDVVELPLEVAGAPVAAPVQLAPDVAVTRLLHVSDVRVVGVGPWKAWFGGVAARRLQLTVVNRSAVAIDRVSIAVRTGRSSTPTELQPSVDAGTFQPRSTRVLTMPLSFEGPALGRYTVDVQLLGAGVPVTAKTHTIVVPWALALLAFSALQLGALRLRDRARRRLARPALVPVAAPTPTEPQQPGTGDEVDLRTPIESKPVPWQHRDPQRLVLIGPAQTAPGSGRDPGRQLWLPPGVGLDRASPAEPDRTDT
jgi:hypothetical protein